jgi:hypothetical protein
MWFVWFGHHKSRHPRRANARYRSHDRDAAASINY